MSKCKTKAIQTNLGTFRHKQTYPGVIQAYLGILRNLSYPDIFKFVVYPEPWHIQNQKQFRTPAYSQLWCIQNPAIFITLAYSKSETYSEPCHTSTMKC